jgi:triosephosphate isomerase
MRKPLIAGNWKMYKTIGEAVQLAGGIKRNVLDLTEAIDVVLCPPFITLSFVYDTISDTEIKLGAQDLYWEKEGAYTGEISPVMLKDCGCEFVIIGHSERRKYFFENDEAVNKKIKAALSLGIKPIVCVGETLEEREAQKTIEVLKSQLEAGLADLGIEDILGIVIAYEPVWAIGTGKNATAAQAQEVHSFIRGWLSQRFSPGSAQALRILYGGSVKPANIKELIKEPDVDGALVGGASLDVGSFSEIIKNSLK